MTLSGQQSEELIDLINELRRNGYNISTEQYIAAQRLMILLAAQGNLLAHPRSLGNMLGPILCTSRDEQKNFPRFYEQWRRSNPSLFMQKGDGGESSAAGSTEPLSKKKLERSTPTFSISWLWVVTAALAIAIGSYFLFLRSSSTDQILNGEVMGSDFRPIGEANVELRVSEDQIIRAEAKTAANGKFALIYQTGDFPNALLRVSKIGYETVEIRISQPVENVVIRLEGNIIIFTYPSRIQKLLQFCRDNKALTALIVGGIILLFVGLWKRLFDRRMELKKWRMKNKPRLENLTVKGATEQLARVLSLRRTAQEMRRHRQYAAHDLDVEKTIETTIDKGLFTPAYTPRKSLPEYLVLIDRTSFTDHQARLVNEIMKLLRENGVFIEHYFFQGDPRICRKDDPKAQFQSIHDLAAQYSEHYLLIFSDGADLFNPITGRSQHWLDMFAAWPTRVLLTSEFQIGDYREWALSKFGFLVLPADKAGFMVLSETLDMGLPQSHHGGGHINPLPTILKEMPGQGLEGHPPAPNALKELCLQLKQFLGAEGYYWLSACAVYPMLYWDLTLYLGYSLVGRDGFDEKLSRLVRLPWFRSGSMPDWLRELLILELSLDREQFIRKILEELMVTSLSQPEGFVLPFVREPRAVEPNLMKRGWNWLTVKASAMGKTESLLDILKSEPKDSPLQDYVFLSFMSGRKPNRLAISIPDELQAFLNSQKESIRVLRLLRLLIYVNLFITGGLLILIWTATSRLEFVVSACILTMWNTVVGMASRSIIKSMGGVASSSVKELAFSRIRTKLDVHIRRVFGGVVQKIKLFISTRFAKNSEVETDLDTSGIAGHPRGLTTLFFTEMWERFSYFGMRSILILFMVAPVNEGGLGFDTVKAAAIYGTYTSSVYLLSLPGGWLGDNFFGARLSVLLGGIIIALGHFSMAFSSMAPFYVGLILIVLGTGLLKPNISNMVGGLYTEEDPRRDSGFSIFYMGINLGAMIAPVVCGTLAQSQWFKALLVRMGLQPEGSWHWGFAAAGVGMTLGLIQYLSSRNRLAHVGNKPEKRKADLTRISEARESNAEPTMTSSRAATSHLKAVVLKGLAYLFWAMGALLAAVAILIVMQWSVRIASWLDPSYWYWFLLFAFLSGLLGNLAKYFEEELKKGEHERAAIEGKHLAVIGILFLFSTLFWMAFEQTGSSLNLFADQLTRTSIFGFTFPSSWFQSVNSIFIIALAPLFSWLWLGMKDRQPSRPAKFAYGLLFVGIGFLVIAYASTLTSSGPVSPMWLLLVFFLHSVGELCLSPVGLSMVTRLGPSRLAGAMVGVWFLSISFGNNIAGWVAGNFDPRSEGALVRMFGSVAIITLSASGVLALLTPFIKRWIKERVRQTDSMSSGSTSSDQSSDLLPSGLSSPRSNRQK